MRVLLLLALVVPTFVAMAQSPGSYNLDFEEVNPRIGLPLHWGLGNVRNENIPNDNSLAAFRVDSVVKQSGKYSLLIDWDKKYGEWTASNYVIGKSFKGKTIKLTGYVKTEGVEESAGLWMRIDGDGKTLAFDNMATRPITGTTDWKEYSVELEYAEEEAIRITVGGLISGKGKLWTDNLHITIDGKDISAAEEYKKIKSNYKAALDTAYNTGSGIATIETSGEKVKILTNLGMLWGFMKYYHAGVCSGDVNIDASLFRMMPGILTATSAKQSYQLMEKWVDDLGKPAACPECKKYKKNKSTVQMPDYGYLFDDNNLPTSLTEKLTYIQQNRFANEKHYYIETAPYIGNPVFTHELSYSSATYPDAGLRLLALYRYWNMIQYFFPYKHLIGEDWNKVLGEFIPVFCNADDTLAYQLACLKLIARIHDTHANVWGGGGSIQKMKGKLIVPLEAEFIEGKLVITHIKKDAVDTAKIMPGDIIEQIDGANVNDLVKKYKPLTPASNYETQLRDLPGYNGFLLRGNEETARLSILRNGKLNQVPVARIATSSRIYKQETEAYKKIDDNIGYIYPAKLAADDLEKVKTLFSDTRGIIIDMRCYPSTFMPFTYGNWLKPKPSSFVKFTSASVDMPGLVEGDNELQNGQKNKKHYNGKLVIIVNARTQSQAEYTTMALSTVPGAVVIGTTTAGADGNVSEITLPGGIKSMISGLGVLYPDGTETQRAGVKIDKVVTPTIAGVKAGRDEMLEAAIKLIKK